MDAKTNLFLHVPEGQQTDAFVVWLIYFLDSDEAYALQKQLFFDDLILKKEDKGRAVGGIHLKRDWSKVLLTFHFKDNAEKQEVLFVDNTNSTSPSGIFSADRKYFPNFYRYLYYKMNYVNSQEVREISIAGYDLITAGMMSAVLEKMLGLHQLIEMYYEYIEVRFLRNINVWHEKLFLKHEYNVLWNADAQKYLCDTIVENMCEYGVKYLKITSSRFGRPWNQIDIARKENDYCEVLFWRVEIMKGKLYLRLIQCGKPRKDEVEYKKRRLMILRKEADNIVAGMPAIHPGKVWNRAIKESEVLIFFLEENDLGKLMEMLPKISSRMIDVFKNLE